MGTKKCCVGGCNATRETHRLFSFPRNDELRKLWLYFLVPTNPLLIGLSKEQLVRTRRVCEQHFDRHQFAYNGRRLQLSYPCLFTQNEISHGVPLAAEWDVHLEHNYSKKEDKLDVPAPSPMTAVTGFHNTIEHNYCNQREDKLLHGLRTSGFIEQPACSGIGDSAAVGINAMEIFQTMETPKQRDDIMDQPSCSGIEFTAAVEINTMENVHTMQMPKQKDVVMDQPSCSGVGYTAAVEIKTMENVQTLQTPKHKGSSRIRKSGKSRKFINHVREIAAESSSDSATKRLTEALNVNKEELLEKFGLLNKKAQTFLLMQLKQVQKSTTGRRITLEEKLLALVLMKQSPKGYKLLQTMFALPNKRTLLRLSEKVSMEAGLNPQIFNLLQESCKNKSTQDKLCTIVFDEVSLMPHLNYNEKKDKIIGFVDVAGERQLKYADHSLVFMLRGICSSWRQSVAYYFCEGTVSAAELQNILKQMVSQVSLTGLIPLGIVCDQGSTFRTAIRKLREDTLRARSLLDVHDDGSVEISGHKLCIFFDPPHLLKGIRNNFLNKDITWNGQTATWKDIQFVYDIDSKLGHTRALPKITAHHVDANKMKKMKVSVAAQVLSARMAAMLKYTDALNNLHKEETTMATMSEVVQFFDELFDSVNGHPGGTKRGKLRGAVTENSRHISFWIEAIEKLKNINFIDKNSKLAVQSGMTRKVKVPSLQGWITTLQSFIRLTKLLFDKYEVDYYYPRYINQDPLENFFGRVRAINYRNVNPDPTTFMYTFKSLLLTNVLNDNHSKHSNCERDDGETLLSIKLLFDTVSPLSFENENKENVEKGDGREIFVFSATTSHSREPSSSKESITTDQVILEKIKVHCSAYTAGYICRKISKKIKCKNCLYTYTSRTQENVHAYIKFREYKALKNSNLVYPTEKLLMLYRDVASIIHSYLNINCYRENIKSNLRKIIMKTKSPSWLGCKLHHKIVLDFFIKFVIRIQVHNWVKIINKILKGEIEEKYVMKMAQPQKEALRKYKKLKIKKKCLNK